MLVNYMARLEGAWGYARTDSVVIVATKRRANILSSRHRDESGEQAKHGEKNLELHCWRCLLTEEIWMYDNAEARMRRRKIVCLLGRRK